MSPALNGSTALLQHFEHGRNTQQNNVRLVPGTATYTNSFLPTCTKQWLNTPLTQFIPDETQHIPTTVEEEPVCVHHSATTPHQWQLKCNYDGHYGGYIYNLPPAVRNTGLFLLSSPHRLQ